MYNNYPSNGRHYDSNYDRRRVNNSVTYNREVEVIDIESKKGIGRCGEITLLVFTIIFVVAATALGIVSTLLESWWIHEDESGASSFTNIKIGLWKACLKSNANADFECKLYTDEGSKSPYQDISVLQYCMIAGIAVCGAAFLLAVLSAVLKICSSKASRVLLYIVAFLSLVGVVLYLVVIGYVLETKEEEKVKPSWIVVNDLKKELKYSIMFFLSCAAAGCAGMSLIMTGVLLFITDFNGNDDDIDDNASDLGVERSNSFAYDHAYRVEQKSPHRKSDKRSGNRNHNGVVHMQNMNGYANHHYGRKDYQNDHKNYQFNDYAYRNMSYEDNDYLQPSREYMRDEDVYGRKIKVHKSRRSSHKHKRAHQPYMSYGEQHRISQQKYRPSHYDDRNREDRYIKDMPSQPLHFIGNSSLNGDMPVQHRNHSDYADDNTHRPKRPMSAQVIHPIGNSYLNGDLPVLQRNHPDYPDDDVHRPKRPMSPQVIHPIGNSYLNGDLPALHRNQPDYPDNIISHLSQQKQKSIDPPVMIKNNIVDKYDMYFDSPY